MINNQKFSANSRVLIIGASGGIGSALAKALSSTYKINDIVTFSRSTDNLDITNENSIRSMASTLHGEFDLIFIATGALEIDGVGPEKTILSMTPEALKAQFETNTLGPALLIKHLHTLLPRSRPSVLAVLTARVGSISDNDLGGWISYRTAKAALHQIIRTSALEIANKRKQSICVALHPGTVQTELTKKYVGTHPSVSPDEAAQNLLNVVNSLSYEDNGQFFDWSGKQVKW